MKKVYKIIVKDSIIRGTGNSASRILFLLAITLTLTACIEDPLITPKLNTLKTVDTDITTTTALLKGEVLILGNMNIIEYGIEISKNIFFSPSQIKGYASTPSPGIYQVEFTDLEPVTKYYYKAYVLINTAQVYSPNNENFTTK